MATVTRSKPDAFENLNLKLKELEGVTAQVGWFPSAKYEDGTPVAYVAAIQEYGSGKIPPRPFMRPAIDQHKQEWMETAGAAAKKVLAGEISAADGMGLLGLQAEGDVLKAIQAVNAPPLSPLTLAARAYRQQTGKAVTGKTLGKLSKQLKNGTIDLSGVNTKPLNDTGFMIATLTHAVETTK